jgi:hypothetical protein
VILGILDEDACLDPVGVCFPDFREEAALPFADAADLMVAIAGALSSTSQLHYLRSVSNPKMSLLRSYPEEFPQRRIVGLARLPLDILQIFRKPKPQHLEHAIKFIVRIANGNECVRLVEVVPVLEVGRWLKELRRKGEAYRCNVCYADESAFPQKSLALCTSKSNSF